MRVVLLNPPGKKIYLRGYYCSQTSKAWYFPQPIDFIMISAWLSKGYVLFLVDAIKDRLSTDMCLQQLIRLKPDVVIFLAGMVSWHEDAVFIREVKKVLNVIVIGIGDVFLEESRIILENNSEIDALLMDFCNNDIQHYLEKKFDKITYMTYRYNNEIVSKIPTVGKDVHFEIPIPRHDLFINKGYIYPFVRKIRYASVLTDYGCPYKCDFCVMGTLHYKYRPLENIFPELDYLKQRGIREILFIDQSFGVLRERNHSLYKEMISRSYNFGWVCYSRVDLVDFQTLVLVKKAGCHTIMFGVETISNELLKKYHKEYTVAQIERAFAMCRQLKIKTVGTFIFGLPEDTKEVCYRTIEFAKKIKCDFASFNFAFPRSRTQLRKQMIEKKLIDADSVVSDQSGANITIKGLYLSSSELLEIKRDAIRQFYIRPGYLIRQLFLIKTIDEIYIILKNGMSIIKNIFVKNRSFVKDF